jgi:hypothetical protein
MQVVFFAEKRGLKSCMDLPLKYTLVFFVQCFQVAWVSYVLFVENARIKNPNKQISTDSLLCMKGTVSRDGECDEPMEQ